MLCLFKKAIWQIYCHIISKFEAWSKEGDRFLETLPIFTGTLAFSIFVCYNVICDSCNEICSCNIVLTTISHHHYHQPTACHSFYILQNESILLNLRHITEVYTNNSTFWIINQMKGLNVSKCIKITLIDVIYFMWISQNWSKIWHMLCNKASILLQNKLPTAKKNDVTWHSRWTAVQYLKANNHLKIRNNVFRLMENHVHFKTSSLVGQ